MFVSQSVCLSMVSVGDLQGVSLLGGMSACNTCLNETVCVRNARCVHVCVCACASVMRGFGTSCDYSRLLRCRFSGSVGPRKSALYLVCGNAHSAPLSLYCCSFDLFFSFFN